MDSSEHRESNVGGATIFLAYIAAALYYTFSTLRQLYVRHLTSISSKEHHGNLKRFTVIFATLSLASFAALSVNMIAFLVVSFQRFDLESHGSGRTAALPMRVLGWLKTSTNFTDFSMQLVHSTTAFWWTSRALRSTLLAFMYMGNLARTYRLPSGLLVNIMVLSQILPISFAMNLFFLAMIQHVGPWAPQKQERLWSIKLWRYVLGPGLLLWGFSRFLDTVRVSPSRQDLMTLVLTARVLLICSSRIDLELLALEAVFVGQLIYGIADGDVPHLTFWLMREGSAGQFAVRALAFDNIIFTISFAIWLGYFGGSRSLFSPAPRPSANSIEVIAVARMRPSDAFVPVFNTTITDPRYHSVQLMEHLPVSERKELLRKFLDGEPRDMRPHFS